MSALLKEYRSFLADNRRKSDHTVRAYSTAAQRFTDFLTNHNGKLCDTEMLGTIKSADIRSYLAMRRSEGLTNRSTARELSAIKAFLRFALGEDAALPIMRAPKIAQSVPRPLSPEDAVNLADDIAQSATKDWTGARDWAVLLMLYGCGLRISEATGLKGDILPLGESIRVTGKRDKTRIIPIIDPVKNAIENYIELCPYAVDRNAPLFRGTRGGALSPALIRRAVQGARKRLGLPDNATPHALRHSFASHLLAGGADLRSLQELLGHASLSSTQVYTAVDTAMLLDEYENAHPRSG